MSSATCSSRVAAPLLEGIQPPPLPELELEAAFNASSSRAPAPAVPHAPLYSGTPPAATDVRKAAAKRVLVDIEHAGTKGTTGEWAAHPLPTDRIGPEVWLRHFILSPSIARGRRARSTSGASAPSATAWRAP